MAQWYFDKDLYSFLDTSEKKGEIPRCSSCCPPNDIWLERSHTNIFEYFAVAAAALPPPRRRAPALLRRPSLPPSLCRRHTPQLDHHSWKIVNLNFFAPRIFKSVLSPITIITFHKENPGIIHEKKIWNDFLVTTYPRISLPQKNSRYFKWKVV